MKEFLKDIFPRIIKYSKTLDDQTTLTDKPWVLFSNDLATREVWIFKRNHELIFSRDGIADKGSWEYLSEMESLYIEIGPVKRLINQAFIDDVVLLLRLDGGKDYIALANEQKIDDTFKMERYLNNHYINIQIESIQPEVLSRPMEVTPPPPLTLDEQILSQKNEISTNKSVLIILLCVSSTFLFISIGFSNNENAIGLYGTSSIILIILFVFILPSYLRSRKNLQSLIDQKVGEDGKS